MFSLLRHKESARTPLFPARVCSLHTYLPLTLEKGTLLEYKLKVMAAGPVLGHEPGTDRTQVQGRAEHRWWWVQVWTGLGRVHLRAGGWDTEGRQLIKVGGVLP